MKFEIMRASGHDTVKPSLNAYPGTNTAGVLLWYIDINSIEDLMNLIKETDERLIITSDEITIYDDYVE